jgi:hypothetical protein
MNQVKFELLHFPEIVRILDMAILNRICSGFGRVLMLREGLYGV